MAKDGLSRFVDLADVDAEDYPADIARFSRAWESPIPLPTRYDGPDGPVEVPTFEVGLVLAGAVSAGAYTAGVLDYLIEVLDDWEVAKERDAAAFGSDFARWTVPPHALRVKVVAGASAGSVCAALVSVATHRRFLPVPATPENIGGPDALRDDNPLYRLWVNDLDVAPMLATDDLDDSVTLMNLPSVLNSSAIQNAADHALQTAGAPPQGRDFPQRRRFFADPLSVALSVANLQGVPFRYKFEGLEGARFATVRHADVMRFAVYSHGKPAPFEERPGGYRVVTGAPGTDPAANPEGAPMWRHLADAAIGSGAFPIAFAPVTLAKDPDDYRFDLRVLAEAGEQEQPLWRQPASQYCGYQEVAGNAFAHFDTADGGTMNNQPFLYARQVLTGPLGRMEKQGDKARKALLIIDPFPAELPREDPNEGEKRSSGKLGIVGVGARLLRAWIDQARYDANDLALSADSTSYSRFMLSPMRARAGSAETALGQQAIASGAMGGFSGFLSRRFRHHDFLLGRRNAENFLRNYLSLPAENALFAGGWWEANAQAGRQYEALTSGPDDAPERLIVPPLAAVARQPVAVDSADRRHVDETRRKLFVRDQLTQRSPIWPGAGGGAFDPDSVAHLFEARIDGVLKIALRSVLGTGLVGKGAVALRRLLLPRISKPLIGTLKQALAEHRLNDPAG